EMVIKPTPEGYMLYSQWERRTFGDLEPARAYALEEAEKQAVSGAESAGAEAWTVSKSCADRYLQDGQGPYLETIIKVQVIGRPRGSTI
ncbi:MAG TPA: hydantoinase/oxoprolinase family protein, partial [Bacillota bacterium]|nr:hydantoinase/oxoprolinase family protein [Bacillota bacterium]